MRLVTGRKAKETVMCEEWWDERLLREQAERLKRSTPPVMPAGKPQEQEKPERKPQNQPDPVPA